MQRHARGAPPPDFSREIEIALDEAVPRRGELAILVGGFVEHVSGLASNRVGYLKAGKLLALAALVAFTAAQKSGPYTVDDRPRRAMPRRRGSAPPWKRFRREPHSSPAGAVTTWTEGQWVEIEIVPHNALTPAQRESMRALVRGGAGILLEDEPTWFRARLRKKKAFHLLAFLRGQGGGS